MPSDPRSKLIDQAQNDGPWDIIVVGGGATGLATAWDAASRGYKVALLEQADFATATSSRSTKLLHGGVRYLQNGELGLVREALHERTLLLKNAPEFSQPMRFILPTHLPLSRYYYRFGMWLYDSLAGKSNIRPAELLSQHELLTQLPNYKKSKPTGGIAYTDAQFDDAALAIAFAQCINNSNNIAINYASVERLNIGHGKITGIIARDRETNKSWTMEAKVVINATGIFSDVFRQENDSNINWSIHTSRGSHIVVQSEPLGSNNALIIPKTTDGRVLFAVPWKGHTIIGTTDEPSNTPELHPTPTEQELFFLIQEAQSTFNLDPQSITSSWAGLRPLVSRSGKSSTASLSRKHIIDISSNGLISILGGKWTTCRKMAEDTIDTAILKHGLPLRICKTQDLKLTDHGAQPPLVSINTAPGYDIPQTTIESCFHERFARNADDILARRTRTSMLNSQLAKDQGATTELALQKLRSAGT
ncbi:MAG: glycerol-3-phosphate dehydrogenase/oxidase [Rubritalea sp.]|uniref:glycerol-3-phosphate dehydrogenase/oxidase n=1 Tax=Rubritalea sp. TaxID=2109375 RepID=UPI0032426E56